jgi:hypothetical protein
MNYNIIHLCRRSFVVGVLSILAVQFAPASNAPVVSGSYEVLQKTGLGYQEQIRLRIRLVNHGPSDFVIQRITLWGSSHPEKGGTQACAVPLHARASAETIQEFTVRQHEYELWQKGLRPRFILEMPGPGTTRRTTVVRLDPTAGKEAK